jgi:DNA recombination protein RmuC
MLEIVFSVFQVVIGVVVGWVLQWRASSQAIKGLKNTIQADKDTLATLQSKLSSSAQEKAIVEERAQQCQKSIDKLEREKSELQSKIDSLLTRHANLTTELSLEKENTTVRCKQHKEDLEQIQEKFKSEFENISNKIYKEKSSEFTQNSKEKINELLSPLKTKIESFQASVNEIYKTGTAERLLLKTRIETIADNSKTLAEETNRLTRALQGDVKKQGTWGELILQKVLEASGLREDEEYVLQGKGQELKNSEGERIQPDVILKLPDNKHIIIDSKMSYPHYEEHFNAQDEDEKDESLKKLVRSIEEHVKDLSEKKYQFADGLESPDFVLMFVPIEAIFLLVIEAKPSLFEDAWKKKVVIVSPANLFAILRTIGSIWNIEKQNRNTQKIAECGAALYDKFVEFLKDLDSLGNHLEKTSKFYQDAMKKLSTGNGNLIRKTEELKKLGLKTKKSIPQEFVEASFDISSKDQEQTSANGESLEDQSTIALQP